MVTRSSRRRARIPGTTLSSGRQDDEFTGFEPTILALASTLRIDEDKLADIHESTEFLAWATKILQRNIVDRFIVLGDITETGKRLRETIEILSAVDAVGV